MSNISENQMQVVKKELGLSPIDDRIVVRPKKVSEKTAGGIYIPQTAEQAKPQKGIVVAVGPGLKDMAMSRSIGEMVLFSKYAGAEIVYRSEVLLIMRQSDILSTIDLEEDYNREESLL